MPVFPHFPLAGLAVGVASLYDKEGTFDPRKRGHYMDIPNTKQEATRGFREPLFNIEYEGRVLAVIGATTAQMALGRVDAIRHLVPNIPRSELLQVREAEPAPIHSPFFAAEFFLWLDSFDSDEDTCPVCGR
jgi:hypothetical protein